MKSRSRNKQRGAVLVEMALVTPILIFMTMATAEVSRLFIDHNTLTKAVRNGARHVASNALIGTTGVANVGAGLAAEARNLVVYGNVNGSGPPVLPGLTTADVSVSLVAGTTNIVVSADHGIGGMLGPVLSSFSGGAGINMTFTLEAEVIMTAL